MTGDICDFALIDVFVFCIAAIEGHLARRFSDIKTLVFVCGCLGREGSPKEEEKEGIWGTAALYVQLNHNKCIDRGKRKENRRKVTLLEQQHRTAFFDESFSHWLAEVLLCQQRFEAHTFRFLERLQHQWITKQLFPGAKRSLTAVMASHHLLAARNLMIHRTRPHSRISMDLVCLGKIQPSKSSKALTNFPRQASEVHLFHTSKSNTTRDCQNSLWIFLGLTPRGVARRDMP